MFRIRQIHDIVSSQDQLILSAVIRIYQEAFSYYPEYAAKIARLLKFDGQKDFEVILLVAEGQKGRILGFTLLFYFPRLKYAYLDYLVSNPRRNNRGYGGALYEATCEWLLQRKCRGLFMDVPPDVPALLEDKGRLGVNKRRMAFYERYGARPIINTLYESISNKANQGYYTYLVYDDLDTGIALNRKDLRSIIKHILAIKGNISDRDPKLVRILDSVRDDPVQLRPPVYTKVKKQKALIHQHTLELVTTGDAQQIHHLREKGYVERPARVQSILKGLEILPVSKFKVRQFAEKHILEVHRSSLVHFLKQGQKELESGQLLYPNVFPIRKHEHVPKAWDMQAGYYCMDNFTPVTANAYRAARTAVNCALTGAERLLKGSMLCYALCRPPGHHAESRVFGGFCYFNNAAIAANYLAGHGKVAFLDIDHHHGNGSQEIFYGRSDVYFISIHGHPRVCYPYFAGYADERGDGHGKGYNKNYPLYPGVDDNSYCEILARAINTFRRFKPDYFVLSLGFDIMAGDPTGTFNITPRGMFRIGKMLSEQDLPVLIVQEGGYSLRNLRSGATEFFRGITSQ